MECKGYFLNCKVTVLMRLAFLILLQKIIHVIYSSKYHLINIFMLNSHKNEMACFLYDLNTNYKVNALGKYAC